MGRNEEPVRYEGVQEEITHGKWVQAWVGVIVRRDS